MCSRINWARKLKIFSEDIKMEENNYDIVIIGGGCAGLTAAIYARRAEKSVLVLEKNAFGGQIVYSPEVENFPRFYKNQRS